MLASIVLYLSIEIKELYTIFHNPSNRDIARLVPLCGENIKKFTKFWGNVYLFRITHNPKYIDPNFGGLPPPLSDVDP